MPKVSVVSAAYNHAKYVTEAVQSVLDQTFRDFELVITDDASTDGTVEKIKQFNDPRLRFLQNSTNQGCSPTYNRSFANSSGDYIAWLDTDDVYEKHALATLVDYLEKNPEKLGVFGIAKIIDSEGLPIGKWAEIGVGADRFELLRLLFQRHRPFCNQAGLVRRQVVEQYGHMAPEFGQSHDTNLWMKILFEGDLVVIPDTVIRYRRHDTNRTGIPTSANLNRGAFENFELLNIFVDKVTSPDLLLKIFPEVAKSPWPLDQKLIGFHIAHLAMNCNSASNQLFGLHLLHQQMKLPALAAYIESACGFTYNDLFHREESLSLFTNGAVEIELDHLRRALAVAESKCEIMGGELLTAQKLNKNLSNRNQEIETMNFQLEQEVRNLRISPGSKAGRGIRRFLGFGHH